MGSGDVPLGGIETCVVCGKEFIKKHWHQICCTGRCSIERQKARGKTNNESKSKYKSRIEVLEFQLYKCLNNMTPKQKIDAGVADIKL